MFYLTNIFVGYLVASLAALGWGTLNNVVLFTHAAPGVYHFHFMATKFLWALLCALILGNSAMPPNKGESVIKNLSNLFHAPGKVIASVLGASFVAGFTDMLYQIFILGGVGAAGLSNTIPLFVGMSTFLGALITYFIERKANLWFFIPGVCFNLLSVFFNTITYRSLAKDQKASEDKNNLLEEGIKSSSEVAILAFDPDVLGKGKD